MTPPEPPGQRPSAIRFRARVLGLGLVVILAAVAIRWARPPRQAAGTAALPEVNQTNLVRWNSRWYPIGQTNPFTGVLLAFYPGGQLQSRSVVSNGFLNGLSEGWYTNGQLQVRETYRTNLSDGVRTKWFPDGNVESEASIVLGQIQGTFRRHYENGNVAEEIPMHNGKMDGIAREYYTSGYVKSEIALQDGKVLTQKHWQDGAHLRGLAVTDSPPAAKPN